VSAASPADWAAAGSAGLGALGLICLALAFVDADPADLDPRPAVRRALDTGTGARLLVELTRLRYTLAALALAVSIRLAVPNGATR
jgi:hypothetical protein